jgi:hypothetical protein
MSRLCTTAAPQESLADLFPWNAFNGTRLELGGSSLDFRYPGCFDFLTRFVSEAFYKENSELRPLLLFELECLAKHILGCCVHSFILAHDDSPHES